MAGWLCGSVIWGKGSWLLPSPVTVARVCSMQVGRVSSAPGSPSTFQDNPRTVEDLPRVSTFELIYRMMFQGYHSRMHELQIYEKQRYGSIYRDGMNAVCVNTAELLEEVLRNDDKFPHRGDMSMWKEYRDMRGYGYGPFTEDGEKWYKLRAVLNKRMLHPRDSAQYGDTLNDIVTDFIKRMYYLRQCSPTADLVTNMANELYRFSLEGDTAKLNIAATAAMSQLLADSIYWTHSKTFAIASIVLETRLGCLENEIPTGTQDFINAISTMLTNNSLMMIIPKWSRSLLPHWGRFIAGWDGIFSFAIKLIDKKMELIQQCLDNKQDVKGEYLTYLLSSTQMSSNDVYGSISELILAGVDTTSNALTWALHLLSMHPQCQERLHKEVSTLGPADRMPSAEEVTQMPYLRAVIKETLRMFPVVPLNGRVVANKDVTIGGYQFSKNTSFTFAHYAISHDEDTFPESFTFKPERWLRDGCDKPNAFGNIPFGFGVRSCVGRRIAELEMYLVLFRLIKHFEIKPDPTMGELKCISRTVLIPDKPVSLHFVDRGECLM